MAVLRQTESGVVVPELCQGWNVHNRSGGSIVANNGISTASFYKWGCKYGGMDASMVSQMKSLDVENRR